jgi:hypothetical protein
MIYSDMKFRDFGTDNCFFIEESRLYKKNLGRNGFKTVEFVAFSPSDKAEDSKLIFIEAKTTLRQESAKARFEEEINDIPQKFMDVLQLVCGVWHGGRKGKVSLPANFALFQESGRKVVFVLVVKNIEETNLFNVKSAILDKLRRESILWKFDLMVLSEELAMEEKLVLARDAV